MHRYVMAAEQRADELLNLLTDEDRDVLAHWVAEEGNIDFESLLKGPAPRIVTILGYTPSKDRNWVEKTPRPKFLREWLAARYWAIEAANALRFAAILHDVPGQTYRSGVQTAAQAAVHLPGRVTIADALFLEMDD